MRAPPQHVEAHVLDDSRFPHPTQHRPTPGAFLNMFAGPEVRLLVKVCDTGCEEDE